MKIATIAYLHGAGGAERQIIMLSNEMAIREHEVHMIVLSDFKAPYPISEKVTVHDLSGKENGKLSVIKRFLAFRSTIKEIRPDITINYNIQGAYFSLLVGKSSCGKILYSERGDPYDKEYSGLLGKVRDFTCRHVDALVFQSEGARDFFNIQKKQKATVIHNSVTVPQNIYPIADKRDNRIVTVGRLHPQKNPHLLLDAFAKIAPQYPDIRLDFYGDGEMHDELQDKINKLDLEHRVKLHPSRKDIFDCIRTARVFVLPSDYEGMPNALMEAMSLGLPCISADCRPGGARTLIKDGQNGFIVPVRNVNALADKIAYLLDNPDIAEQIAKEARHLGETHTNEITFNKWNDFLQSI
ncbi:glycosyltransferase [Prevotellamassilia timonensis]|uniref:glycosyltransferase n=1 Tax=Prevotellamassilia timonensis TaxID=1852370 RepID=UPI003FD814FC